VSSRNRTQKFFVEDTRGPITLGDLMWLVHTAQAAGLPENTHVRVDGGRMHSPVDRDPARITVQGPVPDGAQVRSPLDEACARPGVAMAAAVQRAAMQPGEPVPGR
jgi:hypothetical protein